MTKTKLQELLEEKGLDLKVEENNNDERPYNDFYDGNEVLDRMFKKYDTFENIDTDLGDSGSHYVKHLPQNLVVLPKKSDYIRPRKDADINRAKGKRGGYYVESTFNRYSNKTREFTSIKKATQYSEKDYNLRYEANVFIQHCIHNGYITEREIENMVSSQLDIMNAYKIHSKYSNFLSKISNKIELMLISAREELLERNNQLILDDKSARWIFEKSKGFMSIQWSHEIASLFYAKELLTEQDSAVANTLVLGTSKYKYALVTACMYIRIFDREMKKELEFKATEEHPNYEYSGFSSVFSLFSIGTADFFMHYKALSENIQLESSKPITVNSTVCIIRYKNNEDRDAMASLLDSNNNLEDMELKFTTNASKEIEFCDDRFIITSANDKNSVLHKTNRQNLTSKDFSAKDKISERTLDILTKYKGVDFQKNGVFTMEHESYSGTVLYARHYDSMLKLWLVDVTGYNAVIPEELKSHSNYANDYYANQQAQQELQYIPEMEQYNIPEEINQSSNMEQQTGMDENQYYDNMAAEYLNVEY